jgi:hypothetical protein
MKSAIKAELKRLDADGEIGVETEDEWIDKWREDRDEPDDPATPVPGQVKLVDWTGNSFHHYGSAADILAQLQALSEPGYERIWRVLIDSGVVTEHPEPDFPP